MVENKSGKVIWISSVQGLIGIPSRTSYAVSLSLVAKSVSGVADNLVFCVIEKKASKFAVQGYCEGLRAEMASSGVTIHVASPGYILTGLSLAALTGDGKPHGQMDETTVSSC